jgi:hypothetical protein
MKLGNGKPTNEESLELKYCERCGGLWLRPANGGQIYCVICSREMAKLPPPSSRAESVRTSRGPGSVVEDSSEAPLIDVDAELSEGCL